MKRGVHITRESGIRRGEEIIERKGHSTFVVGVGFQIGINESNPPNYGRCNRMVSERILYYIYMASLKKGMRAA